LRRVVRDIEEVEKLLDDRTDSQLNAISDPFLEEFDCSMISNFDFLKKLISRKSDPDDDGDCDTFTTDEQILRYIITHHSELVGSLRLEHIEEDLCQNSEMFLCNPLLYQRN
jgi:hypothetical protein